MKKIIHTEWGLANSYKDKIEINKNLQKYPKLYSYVLKHELGHKESFDLHHDFKVTLNTFYLMLFCLRYPKTLIDLLPIMYRNGDIEIDINKCILYSLIILLTYILFKIF